MASNLAEKLLIKPESRVLLLNAPIGYAKKLQPLPEGVTITDRRSQTASEAALVFVRDTAELKRLQSGFATLEEDAALWVCYPEGGTAAGADLNRDMLNAALKGDELTGVARVAFDETWTCVQFRTPRMSKGSRIEMPPRCLGERNYADNDRVFGPAIYH